MYVERDILPAACYSSFPRLVLPQCYCNHCTYFVHYYIHSYTFLLTMYGSAEAQGKSKNPEYHTWPLKPYDGDPSFAAHCKTTRSTTLTTLEYKPGGLFPSFLSS